MDNQSSTYDAVFGLARHDLNNLRGDCFYLMSASCLFVCWFAFI